MRDKVSEYVDLSPAQVPETITGFLNFLGGPAVIRIGGVNPNRTRAVVTLLHGNEPSGVRALHRMLREGVKPLTNMIFILGSVEAALIEPGFRCRSYPESRDMNRCFNPPYQDAPGLVAREILRIFDEERPEAVVDIHNTSGTSPSFAVVTNEDARHEALAGLFTDKLVITDLRLGSLMEQTRADRPIVTVECGGANDQYSDSVAYEGLLRFCQAQELFNCDQDLDIELYHHPIRLELAKGTKLAFAEKPALGMDLTFLLGIDRYNFRSVPAGTLLGWLRLEDKRSHLRVVDQDGCDRFDEFFEICGNRLQTIQALKLFMVTDRPDIALSDCLLYAAFESDYEKLHLHIEAVAESVE